jgi:hypothetical protein
MNWPAVIGTALRRLGCASLLSCGLLACAGELGAQTAGFLSEGEGLSIAERLRLQESEIAALRSEVERHSSELRRLPGVDAEECSLPAGD